MRNCTTEPKQKDLKVHKGELPGRLNKPVISIGVFDGVHRGHAAIFSLLKMRAVESGGESVIVTFDPHPRMVTGGKGEHPGFLTTLDEKARLIGKHGIDHLIVINFTSEFSKIPPCRFIREYLVERTGLAHLVFGFDHHFGHRREGNYQSLQSCARLYGFSVEQLGPVTGGGRPVSSSLIREMLSAGNVREAAGMLSWHYSLRGRVTGGLRLGRSIGYPTANISPEDPGKLIPADGVYAVCAEIEGTSYPGMMNIGFRPTLSRSSGERTLEVHIIGFEGDIYDSVIGISFIERLRDEKRFDSLGLLKKQLAEDRVQTLQATGNCWGQDLQETE